ncbi:MAG TPA: POTRA domain-containing protein [Terriglobales bacterium]|nr:POTRA domain-containing protein [Terriglobales bacterium]
MKFALLLALFLTSPLVQARVSTDDPKVIIDEVDVEGAAHMPELVKKQLVADLLHSEYAADSDWIGSIDNKVEQAEFAGWPERENQGYVGFSVQATSKTLRKEPSALHVLVTVLVNEGHQKHLKEIDFRYVEEHTATAGLTPTELRKLVPLSDGDIYNREKFYAGMSAISRAYHERGFIDLTYTIEMRFDQTSETVAVFVSLTEGEQYRWGKIQVIGLRPMIELSLKSKLKPGDLANPALIDDFYHDNQSLLPTLGSPREVKWYRNRDHATVDLTFDFRAPRSP